MKWILNTATFANMEKYLPRYKDMMLTYGEMNSLVEHIIVPSLEKLRNWTQGMDFSQTSMQNKLFEKAHEYFHAPQESIHDFMLLDDKQCKRSLKENCEICLNLLRSILTVVGKHKARDEILDIISYFTKLNQSSL